VVDGGGVPWEGVIKSGVERVDDGKDGEKGKRGKEGIKKTDQERSECQFGDEGTRRPTWTD
jgi:hypothetical protein